MNALSERICLGCDGGGFTCVACLGSRRIAPIDTHLDARSDVSQWDLFVSEELERYKALPWLRSEA